MTNRPTVAEAAPNATFFLLLLTLAACSPASAEDVARRAPPVNLSPGPEYADSVRAFQGIPAVERAARGRLWAAWYGGGTGEDLHNYVMLATGSNDAQTWSGLKMVIDPDGDGPCRAFDPCLWHDPQGRLWLFWSQRDQTVQVWAIVTTSPDDENPNWSAPQPIAAGILMNKPIVCRSGAWLAPVAQWKRDGSAHVVRSTDAGSTWELLGRANIPDPATRDCDEHMLIERRDQSLWMLLRTRYGIGESMSTDQGRTWSDVKPAPIQHATSRFFIRRLSSGNLLLVKHGPIDERTDRSRLMAFLSPDDGQNWSGSLLLDERRQVSYPDGVESPSGTIYLIYDYSRGREKQILLATFTEADVVASKCVSPAARLQVVVNQATRRRPVPRAEADSPERKLKSK